MFMLLLLFLWPFVLGGVFLMVLAAVIKPQPDDDEGGET